MSNLPPELKQAQLNEIIARLGERQVLSACPRCNNTQWNLQGHLTNIPLHDPRGNVVLPGPAVPACMLVCVRCGFISLHALGVLGLMHIAEAQS